MPSVKRAAAKEAAPKQAVAKQAKRAKKEVVDPRMQRCREVASAIHQSDAPAAVVDMVEAMLDDALLTYKEERHEFQDNVLDMAAKLLESAKNLKVADVETAKVAIAAGEETKEAAHAAAAFAKSTLEGAVATTSDKKRALAACAKAFQAAKQTSEQAYMQQAMREQELLTAASKKERLLSAEHDYLKPLLEGVEAEGKALTAVLANFAFDASLVAALPNALAKAPSLRGPFDVMVLEQVGKDFGQRVATLDATLSQNVEATVADAAAVREAIERLDAASAAQEASADAFEAAQQAAAAAKTAWEDVQQTLKACAPELRKLAKEHASAVGIFGSFRRGPLACFASLRERASPAPAAAEEALEEEAATEADEPAAAEDEVAVEAEAQEQGEDAEMNQAEESVPAHVEDKVMSFEEPTFHEATVIAAGA